MKLYSTLSCVSLFYVQQAALLLLCTNRCLSMVNAHWLEFLMSYQMHIIYSAVCWLFVWDFHAPLLPHVISQIMAAYLFIIFILTISMCIGLYIVIYRHLRSTALSTNDRERYRQMRSIANMALMQSLFPIVTHLPTTIISIVELLLSSQEFDYIVVVFLPSSPILTFIVSIPSWIQPYSAILIVISIVLGLGELCRKVASVLGRLLKFVTQATSQLFPTSNVMQTTKVAPYSTTAVASSKTNTAHG